MHEQRAAGHRRPGPCRWCRRTSALRGRPGRRGARTRGWKGPKPSASNRCRRRTSGRHDAPAGRRRRPSQGATAAGRPAGWTGRRRAGAGCSARRRRSRSAIAASPPAAAVSIRMPPSLRIGHPQVVGPLEPHVGVQRFGDRHADRQRQAPTSRAARAAGRARTSARRRGSLCHARPRRPRPAVCCSATSSTGSSCPARARRISSLLVESISGRTSTVKPGSSGAACSQTASRGQLMCRSCVREPGSGPAIQSGCRGG